MLVNNISVFQKHVIVNYNFKFEVVEPLIRKQERKHIRPLLGRSLYDEISSATEGIEKEILELLQEASSHLALMSYTKVGVVSITNSGFSISDNENTTPPTWGQLLDMRRELLHTGMEAIDEALILLEENEELFPGWKSSEGYTTYYELFTRNTKTFQRYFNIENSRLTFLRLKPHLLKVENKYFKGLLGMETVNQIKQGSSPEEEEALQLCQAAQVPLAVSEIANEGALPMTSRGLFYEIEEIPGNKNMSIDEIQLRKLYAAKQEEGNEQLKALVVHLRSYPETFKDFAKRESKALPSTVHNTKSIVSF